MKDYFGREIKSGAEIVYPVNRSRAREVHLSHAVVEDVVEERGMRVRPLSVNQKTPGHPKHRVWLRHPRRIVVVKEAETQEEMSQTM